MSIVIAARAQADIDIASEELTDTYGVAISLLFQRRLAETLRRLERLPLAVAPIDPPYPKHPELRVRPVYRFRGRLVYYVPITDGIRVFRVLHSAQDANAIFG